MSQREDALKFETGRIKALQEERLHIQKKTFTKWMNSFLVKARMEVEDLFTDLADGKKLLKLLEIISGEKLGKPNNGRMRVHKIENVNKSLAFLHTKVRLESIGAEDIVDGNPRLILGLIWTIILRFQIQEIEIDVDEENESSEKKSAKDALLLWCQRKTNGYQNVNIQDFTGSWRSGLGFNALIHAHRPDLIDYNGLVPTRHIDNLNNAFDTAERSLGIPRLLDAEDIDTSKPDEKSVLTYVASYYHTFAQMYNKDKSGRRIANIISQIKEADDLKYKYELDGKSLLAWIRETIKHLNSRDFPNNLEGVQKLLVKFKEHITVNKPPKYNEKSEIEANYFIINTRLKELNQHVYVPPEGLLVHDIERAWEELEKAEYLRELALREEVIRQTNLEQLAIRFEKKSLLREGYLKDMIQVLSDPRYGINLAQVEATLKKHEAISADILAREQRCEQLVTMADYLVKENYHDCERVRARADEISRTWAELIKLLDNHKMNLERFSNLMQLVRDVDTILSSIHELEDQLVSDDVGVHLIGVEDLLQNHSLVESLISSMGDTIKRIGKTASGFSGKELSMVEGKIKNINEEYEKVLRVCKERRCKLEDSRAYFLFVQDCEEEESWVNEKLIVCGGNVNCKDLRGVLSLIGSHKVLLDENKARRGKIVKICERGNELVRVWEKEGGNKETECKDVNERIKSLEGKWNELRASAEGRSQRLAVVLEAFQFYSDANEMDSWITEKRPLVSSSDYGSDEPSAQALLQRHVNLEEEIIAYEADVKGLNSQADKLVQAGINSIVELSETSTQSNGVQVHHQNGIDEYVTEQKLVPQEYWEDEVVEKTDYKTVTEERAVPQVKALYAFQGQEIEIKKGEVMFLLNKTNSDWWNVRKANGEDGFVPANYVKEIEPKVVMVQVRKPEVVKETKRVKKTRMVLQSVQKPKKPPSPLKKSQSSQSLAHQQNNASNNSIQTEPIVTRTQRINTDYSQIQKLSGVRKQNLLESIKLFQFLRECEDFEKWINEKKKYLSTPEPNVQAAKRSFEKFLTDLSASGSRITEIDNLVKQFDDSKTNAATKDKVHQRAEKIKKLYNELLSLKAGKEKTLEGALSVELFNRTCEEVQDWMNEKMMQIDTDEWSNDLKTVQALQRKHNNLERELAPINEKVQRVNLLAESVKKSYPSEEKNVDEKKHEVVRRWETLVQKANERKHALEHAVGFQIFDQGVKSLMNWVGDSKAKMQTYVRARDVSSAEEALKVHSELGDEIKAKDSEFDEFLMLGSKIQHVGNEVGEKMELLKRERNAVAEEFAEKSDWLNQVLDLQVFLREADHIDSCTRNHVQFVQSTDVGCNLDEVESLIKRHGDFENTLVAQDERLKVFDSMGCKLIEAGHFEETLIRERRDNVIQKKREVKELAKTRKSELHRSLKYHEFNNDVEETLAWVNEKVNVAKDESYKDLTNVDKKLKKHEAFAGELRANEVRIKNINRAGEKLVEVVPEKTPEINASVDKLNQLWDELVVLSSEKYDKLRQAEAQASFNKNLDSVIDRLSAIKNNLQAGNNYGDRRSCKDAVKRANSLGAELGAVDGKIKELEKLADEMEKEKHFDAGKIRDRVLEARSTMDLLVGPVEKLKGELGNAYEYYSFLHELDAEGSWMKEKQALVEQEYVIQDLYQAQTSVKKHKKLEQEVNNREPVVLKLVEKGANFKGDELKSRIDEFENLWKNLKQSCSNKSKKLELSLKSQQFFFDAGEIETWMNEKEAALSSKDFGKDIHSARVLLTKHKGIELEMDSYDGLVNEMKHMANAMVASGHPDKNLISAKINGVDEHMGLLRRLGNERREKLIRRVGVLEYFAEVDEFVVYVDEVFGREVGSNEYGVDYEHLQVLKGRFREVELKVEGVNERFRGLEDMAGRLSGDVEEDHNSGSGGGEGSRSVDSTATFIREKWNNMLALMAAREQKLHAAGEIHAFNRDVADSLARINEKLNSIPDTVGRDVNSCESMLRQHEAFENDLLALEAQLQVLVDDASRLQSLYPTNAQNIRQEQSLVIESWNNLQSRATLRKEQLQNAVDFWRFSAEYANLTSFINSLLTTLPSQPKVRDTASSQGLMNEHERIRSEIDARDDQFDRVFSLGGAMVEEDHPESGEVARMISNLRNLKEKLVIAWEHKKVYLDQLIDLNIFLRDAKQLETVCNTQEVSIGNLELGDDVESVDKNLKKHEAFEKLVLTQEEKFGMLEVQGMKLVRQHHFDSDTVKDKLLEVKGARSKVKELCLSKRNALEERSKYVRFLRDVTETTVWVDEKIKKLQLDESVNKELNLNEKIKKLKKHQAFSAEVASNQARIEGLFKVGSEVGADNELVQLKSRWVELVKLVQEFGKGLEEAQDILEFTNQCELTDAWVREKESLVNAGDVGGDYEHCCEIIKRVDDFDSEVKVDDERIKGLNALAQRLIKGGGDHGGVVSGVITGLNGRWENLKVGLEGYRRKLERALDVHKFNRDAEEVEERIKSVRGLISGDVGRDLEHCEGLVRKHEGVEVQVNAVGERVKELENERVKLIEKGVDSGKLNRIDEAWLDVSEACLERRNALTSSLDYHKFLKKFADLKRFVDSTTLKVQNTNLGSNVQEAEEALKHHKELIDNVQARDVLYHDLVRVGKRFVVEKHEYSTDFSERVSEIDEIWGKLNITLKDMSGKLDQSLKMQRLFARINEVEVEIECNDAFLNGRELGENLGAVLVLVRRHEDFTNAFGGMEVKVTELIQQGDKLLEPGHFDAPAITNRLSDLKSKLEKLKAKALSRSLVLHESYELHKFVLEIHEIEAYALEKLKIALDDNYTDMVNLQSKIQRHAAFESEVQANYERINGLMGKGESLLKLHDNANPLHSFMVEIQRKLDNIQSVWKELQVASSLKRERLQESYQALLFNQNLDDIEGWMDELESQLESEDHGVDLESVRALINKWMHLESEFLHKKDVIGSVCKTADAFVKANHYLAEDISARVDGIKSRYESLSEPLHIRRENLEETNKFFEFLRDVGEEREWVDEKIPSVGVDAELGANLTQVQSLQKKHNQLESEIISHEPLVGLLVTRSTAMVRSGHFASDQIQTVTRSLQERFQELKDSAAVRRLRLADSMLSQTFYDEANELLSWMNEKSNYVRNVECKDCENVSGLLKRLDAFQRDLATFHQRIDKVLNSGEELVNRGHFDSEKIQAKKQEVSHEYSELQKTSDKKRLRVSDAMKFYEFNKVCNECVDWINEMMNIAGSEEYGRDVEHVEVLIQKFESFYGNVQESRVQVVGEMADGLVEEGYPDVERVRGRANEVKCMWEEFKELAQARLEALQGAKQVHAFDRTADETISWINEKHSTVCSEEYGHDLESIQSLIRRHVAFENDLKPVEAKVTEVKSEASRLRNLFVDASEHINVKLHACEESWKELVERTRTRGDKLNQAENLQAYFDDYTNLMAFVNELIAKATSGELGRTVRAAEASLGKNEELLKEIDQFKGVDEFCKRGQELVNNGHFMREEINDKIKSLRSRWDYLRSVGRDRNQLFKKNLDLRVFLVQVDEFDKWMGTREPELKDYNLGESIREVEELIREHEEFTHTLEAQETKLEGLRRSTLIEQAWEEMRKREQLEREEQAKKVERERIEGLKRREVERITGEIVMGRKDNEKESKENASGSGNVRGGFLGGSRFGSLVFGSGARRGSEPATSSSPTTTTTTTTSELLNSNNKHFSNNNNNSSSPFKISITPPPSLEHIASQQQQQQHHHHPEQQLLSRSESLRLLNTSHHHQQHADSTDTSTLKKPKRTPSFTTRRRTASFRRKKNPESLPPVEIEGYLERKHELQAGGKRAAVRSWKHYYVLLCGQLLCFFKDQEDFEMSKVGSSSPISIYKCVCSAALDYTKRKFVFRVKPADGSEFLFAAESNDMMENWVRKINFHAQLEPKDQLLGEGEQQQQQQIGQGDGQRVLMPPPPPPPKHHHYHSSSSDDDDDHHHPPQQRSKPKSSSARNSNSSSGGGSSLQQPRSREPIYAEDTQLDQQQQQQPPAAAAAQSRVAPTTTTASKPPIPPRSSSIENGRSPVKGNDVVDNNQYFVHSTTPPHHHQQQQRPMSVDRTPSSASSSTASSPFNNQQQLLSPRSSGSLPPGLTLSSSPTTQQQQQFLHDPNSSSENEQGGTSVHSSSPSPHAADNITESSKKKKGHGGKDGGSGGGERGSSSGLMGLFRRKKATQL